MADSALILTGDEWNLLAAICEDWLGDGLGDPDDDSHVLARRIIVAAEAGNA